MRFFGAINFDDLGGIMLVMDGDFFEPGRIYDILAYIFSWFLSLKIELF
jgi:hypothetical protein